MIKISEKRVAININYVGLEILGINNKVRIEKNNDILKINGVENEITIAENNGIVSISGAKNRVRIHKNNCYELYDSGAMNDVVCLDEHQYETLEDEIDYNKLVSFVFLQIKGIQLFEQWNYSASW